MDAHYETLEELAGLLASEGFVLLSSMGRVTERGSHSSVSRNSCLTWKDGKNETRVELFEPGMVLEGVTNILKERHNV